MDNLPDEILLEVFRHLDSVPLSQARSKRRPLRNAFSHDRSPLKQLSLTSRRFRRVVQPMLSRHAVLNIGSLVAECELETERRWQNIVDQPKFISLLLHNIQYRIQALRRHVHPHDSMSVLVRFDIEVTMAIWVKELLDTYMYQVWRSILSAAQPNRIAIHAPRRNIAWLLSCEYAKGVFTWTDDERHEYQLLELYPKAEPFDDSPEPRDADYGLATKSCTGYRLSHASVLHMRRWSHIALNEGLVSDGSFQPASIYRPTSPNSRDSSSTSLLYFLFPPCCLQSQTDHSHRWAHVKDHMSFLDEFSYTAIHPHTSQFPSSAIQSGVHRLQFVRKLNLRLLPDPEDSSSLEVDDEAAADTLSDALRTYKYLRVDLIKGYQDPDWRLATVNCEDHDCFRRKEASVENFDHHVVSAAHSIQLAVNSTNHIPWGKTWRVQESLEPGDSSTRELVIDEVVRPKGERSVRDLLLGLTPPAF